MTQAEISENLKAAGCSSADVKNLAAILLTCGAEEKNRLLAKERSRILESLHKCEYELNCIDYLAYKMRKDAAEPQLRINN